MLLALLPICVSQSLTLESFFIGLTREQWKGLGQESIFCFFLAERANGDGKCAILEVSKFHHWDQFFIWVPCGISNSPVNDFFHFRGQCYGRFQNCANKKIYHRYKNMNHLRVRRTATTLCLFVKICLNTVSFPFLQVDHYPLQLEASVQWWLCTMCRWSGFFHPWPPPPAACPQSSRRHEAPR